MFLNSSHYATSTTHFSSQSKSNSCFNTALPNVYITPNYPLYQNPQNPPQRTFMEQPVFNLDSDKLDYLCPEFNNLFIYDRIWTPLNAQTTTTTKQETIKSSTFKQTTRSQSTSPAFNAYSPIASSTPRAIRKSFMPSSTNNRDSQATIRPEQSSEEKRGKSPVRQFEPECKQNKKKFARRKLNQKKNLNSTFNSIESSSPNSDSSHEQRKLPLRSKGIDLSVFLKKASDASSVCSGGNSSDSSHYGQKFKGNVQNGCLFCENNGESEEIFMSHPLKDSLGKVVCPILRSYVCPKCGESGDFAHTNKYCPETQRKQKENKIKKYFSQKDF